MTWTQFAGYMTAISIVLSAVVTWLWRRLEWWD